MDVISGLGSAAAGAGHNVLRKGRGLTFINFCLIFTPWIHAAGLGQCAGRATRIHYHGDGLLGGLPGVKRWGFAIVIMATAVADNIHAGCPFPGYLGATNQMTKQKRSGPQGRKPQLGEIRWGGRGARQ